MEDTLVTTHKAIKTALEMADFIIIKNGASYPAFFTMSDARVCAMLLSETTGKLFFARQDENDDDPAHPIAYYVG